MDQTTSSIEAPRNIAVFFFSQSQMYIFLAQILKIRDFRPRKCFKYAENWREPFSLCSESIARVGLARNRLYPGLKTSFVFGKPGSELR